MTAAAANAGPGEGSGHAARLADEIEGASELLYHASKSGKELEAAVRDPIIRARGALERGETWSAADESAFLAAYAKLAALTAPVTAATLRATRRRPARAWWAKLLRLGPTSDAQVLSFRFGVLALALLLAIGAGEWTRTFIAAIIANQDDLEKVKQELRATDLTPSRQKVLMERRVALEERIAAGYATLNRSFGAVARVRWEELRNLIGPVADNVGGFLLPVLYGALGTTAFILRRLYASMVNRTFDARRSGEFLVRIFLGMLSGITLQWIVVRDGNAVPGGVTPAVLAFLGGYSVELLFAAIDRLLGSITAALKATARSERPNAETRPQTVHV